MSKRPIGTRTEIVDPSAPAITVNNLHKSFRLPTEQAFGLKQTIFNRLRGIKGYKEQKVLKGLNFEIKQGEFLGIVGKNGSGKSTLLKILAGIYYPEKVDVTINGTLVPFIELGVGFNPELTGRENVYMTAPFLGSLTKKWIRCIMTSGSSPSLKNFKIKNSRITAPACKSASPSQSPFALAVTFSFLTKSSLSAMPPSKRNAKNTLKILKRIIKPSSSSPIPWTTFVAFALVLF